MASFTLSITLFSNPSGRKGEGACPTVYRPVSVDDEEPAGLRGGGELGLKGKETACMPRLQTTRLCCCFLQIKWLNLADHVFSAHIIPYRRVIID